MAITNARMQMRRGNEADFDPDKMTPGEWAVSLDKKYVRMCFSPGVCVRMATYDAFEKDMAAIQDILAECQTIEQAVTLINTQISANAKAVAENTSNAKTYMETASSKANEASGYAQTASSKAVEALQSANSAANSMETATKKANSASQSANVATEKANESIMAANSAIESAENADLSESNAKKSEDNAYDYSNISKSYAVGETGERLGEETDNSKYYSDLAKTEADRAKTEADRASSIANVGIATTEKAGIVKPDGETIRIDTDGTIHADNGTVDYNELENKPSINGTELNGNKSLSDLGIASDTDLQEVETKVDTIIEKAELNIKNSASGENIHLTDSANGKNVAFSLYGKAKQDGEPTPDNPIEINVSGSDGSVEVVSCGKNLLENTATSKTDGGVTFTVNEDGSVTCNGTATSDVYYNFFKNQTIDTLKNGNAYIVSGDDNNNCQFFIYNVTQGKGYGKYYSGITEMTVNDSDLFNVGIKVLNGSVVNTTIYPMIRLASDTDATYEPYKETVSTIPTSEGLAGIPVESGGNYTDENGQQWICDEVVKYADGSGKRIQRIGKAVFDGSSDEGWKNASTNVTDKVRKYISGLSEVIKKPSSNYDIFNGISNTFKAVPASGTDSTYHCNIGVSFGIDGNLLVYSDSYNTSDVSLWTAYLAENPMTLYYELAEPIITDLTAEEIAEIEKLYTFYPITNIFNDADCGMAVTYIADSKLYIDNQLAIQKAQQEEALATMLLLMPEEVQASMIENDTNNLLNESEV